MTAQDQRPNSRALAPRLIRVADYRYIPGAGAPGVAIGTCETDDDRQ
jgi:hypothetical protein